jgi:hypothetical protein
MRKARFTEEQMVAIATLAQADRSNIHAGNLQPTVRVGCSQVAAKDNPDLSIAS